MDTSKIIIGTVGGGRYTVTAPIVKEDYGLYLLIEGLELPSTYEVDFSNSEHNGTSVTMIGNADGVLIPSQFISSGKDVFAFLYHVGDDYGRTVYKFRIPNKVRPDRTDEEPTPEEQSVIDQTISALNDAVEQTAQDKADADVSAQNASADAERAEKARTDAQNYATQAEQSATNAQTYALQANASATASATSASQSAQIKDDVESMVDDAQASADASEQSAEASARCSSDAQDSAEEAKGYAQRAEDALEEFTTPTASATTLQAGSSATASYANGRFSFGIPRGDKGERGERGLQGDDYILTEQDKQDIADLIPVPEGGGMVVTATIISGTLYSVDKTYAEIGLAVTEGSNVVLISDGKAYPYAGMMYLQSAPVIVFGSFFAYEGTLVSYGFIVTMNGDDTLAQKIRSETAIPTLSDVQINGQSIVADGVANVPIATTTLNGAMSSTDKQHLDSVYADYSSALTALGVI